MRQIIRLQQPKIVPKKIRVAAYARVSRPSERSTHSLAAQVSYYSNYIQSKPDWEYAGVYIDSFVTGTTAVGRNGFNELISDCDASKIDMVMVKSISRFARNTLDLLNTVRHLKDIGVAVYFEKENINTLTSDGEFLLTVLASFAQEEVTSISNNIKWAFGRKFKEGNPIHRHKVLGYDWQCDELIINEAEAEIVRRLYKDYLDGSSVAELLRTMKTEHPELNMTFQRIVNILTNEKYIGRIILQKTYSDDPITKKTKINNCALPIYIVDEHHEPVIDKETFKAVQAEKQKRMELGAISNKFINTSPMTGKIKCGYCGNSYIKNTNTKNGKPHITWNCRTKIHDTAAACGGRIVPDDIIRSRFTKVTGQDFNYALFEELISEVIVSGTDTLEFHFKDGGTVSAKWELTGNKDRWTDEERAKKKEYAKRHPFSSGTITCFTAKIQCGRCGENFRRKHIKSGDRYLWGCSTGKKICGIRWIRETELKRVLTEILHLSEFDEQIFTDNVQKIIIISNEELIVCFKDNSEQIMPWNSKRVKKEKI